MKLTDKQNSLLVIGKDYPKLMGNVKLKLHNPTTGKTEVYEHHNDPTNALKHIFAMNAGGIVNYNNFADLYNTWLGGVLIFESSLDTSSSGWADDYGIPARTSNKCVAHAGQRTPSDLGDDSTRGYPDSSGTVVQAGSTKLVWEWGTSLGNGTISSLGLTHKDVGDYGCGVESTAQQSLNPFVQVGSVSKGFVYADTTYTPNANGVLAVDGNMAYTFMITDNTHITLFKTPINNTKFKLQGSSLVPLADYTSSIQITLTTSIDRYNPRSFPTQCYYWFDFANSKLTFFSVPTSGGATLYKDEVNLANWADQTATHTSITLTGCKLWKLYHINGGWEVGLAPTPAMIYGNYLFLYGVSGNGYNPDILYKVNLTNNDVDTVDSSLFSAYCPQDNARANERWCSLGGIIVHDSFLVNGDKTFPVSPASITGGQSIPLLNYAYHNKIASPVFYNTRQGTTYNMVSVCKLYLATKWNLQSAVTKTSAQSMTVEYTLTEV